MTAASISVILGAHHNPDHTMNHTHIGHLEERNTRLDSLNVLIHALQAFSGIMLMLIGYFSLKIWSA